MKEDEVGGTCGTHGGGEGVYRVLVGRPEDERPMGRPRYTWEDNIKMDHRGTGINDANWIQLVQNRVQWLAFANAEMNLRVPYRKQDIF
jgi:hypothetical protein